MSQAEALLLQARTLLAERRVEQACEAYTKAERSGADVEECSAGRWLASMLAGRFAEAWQESDAIHARGKPDPHRFWNGEPPAGRHVIVRSLHGFGDAVQMLRYAPQLRTIAASVSYEVAPELLPLARFFDGVEQVLTWEDAPPAWDLQVEITELPYLFRTELRELPIATNYLRLPSDVRARESGLGRPAGKPRIGLVWAAGEWNPRRSVPIHAFASLLADERFEVWSLQGGAAAEVTQDGLQRSQHVEHGGLLALASTIAELDLVVTVDTLAAHLAGALGKPACVLLEHAADWRWMVKRDDSPWYPTLRLLRQPEPGNWRAVMEALQEELEERFG